MKETDFTSIRKQYLKLVRPLLKLDPREIESVGIARALQLQDPNYVIEAKMMSTFVACQWPVIWIDSEAMVKFVSGKIRKDEIEMVLDLLKTSDILDKGLTVHFLKGNVKNSIFFAKLYLSENIGEDETGLVVYGEESLYLSLNRAKGALNEGFVNNPFVSIAVNTLLSFLVFRETLREGVPNRVMSANGIRSKSTSYFMSAPGHIEEAYEKRKILPHMRRGHFRKLESDYYKEKRGTIVFVRPTMVAGKGATAEDL